MGLPFEQKTTILKRNSEHVKGFDFGSSCFGFVTPPADGDAASDGCKSTDAASQAIDGHKDMHTGLIPAIKFVHDTVLKDGC